MTGSSASTLCPTSARSRSGRSHRAWWWRTEVSRAGSPTPTRQACSLLRATLTTAVADEVILRNPCVIKGAGVSRAVERPIATIPQVLSLAEAVPAHYRAFVLTATWSSARWGELVALSRDRLDLVHGTMTIDRQLVELRGCVLKFDTPNSEVASEPSIYPRISFPSSSIISGPTCRRTDLPSSLTRRVSRSSAAHSEVCGCWRDPRRACRTCGSTISVTPGTQWRPRQAPAPASSWRGWVLHLCARR